MQSDFEVLIGNVIVIDDGSKLIEFNLVGIFVIVSFQIGRSPEGPARGMDDSLLQSIDDNSFVQVLITAYTGDHFAEL
jgi:hypothetical protein